MPVYYKTSGEWKESNQHRIINFNFFFLKKTVINMRQRTYSKESIIENYSTGSTKENMRQRNYSTGSTIENYSTGSTIKNKHATKNL